MKIIFYFICIIFLTTHVNAQQLNASEENMKSLGEQTSALGSAFAKGDVALVASLHHPDIIKYFGGKNVVTGRAALEKGLREWFHTTFC